MDKPGHYRNLIRKTLIEHCQLANKSSSTVETITVFDEQSDNYLLIQMGWKLDKRIKNTTLHVRLLNHKIWIEEDWTEQGVVTDFIDLGVPDSDLVLAFHPPHLRQYTDFAIA